MGLLQDLVNGKDMQLSDGSKVMVLYKPESGAMTISIGGNEASLTQEELTKLMQLESVLRIVKSLEVK